MRKPKRYTISGLSNKVATRLQLLRIMQEADEYENCLCITCGDYRHYKEMHGGHFIERGKMATKLDPLNIWPQCPGCNMFGMKKASVVLEYAKALNERFPGLADDLKRKSGEVKKYTRLELEELLEQIESEIREAETRIRDGA